MGDKPRKCKEHEYLCYKCGHACAEPEPDWTGEYFCQTCSQTYRRLSYRLQLSWNRRNLQSLLALGVCGKDGE